MYGQWWSISSVHKPHCLQWCVRSGLYLPQIRQYLALPSIFLSIWKTCGGSPSLPLRVLVGSHGNFDGTRPGEQKCANEKLVTTSTKTLEISARCVVCVFKSPIIGTFGSTLRLKSRGKNAAKKDAYIKKMKQTKPGMATPYEHDLLFPIQRRQCANGQRLRNACCSVYQLLNRPL